MMKHLKIWTDDELDAIPYDGAAEWAGETTVGEPDDEDARRVTHYDPQMELIGQRAELVRLRDVEKLARELVRFVNFESLLYHSETRVRARSLLARVRAAGFLSEVR